MVKPRRLLSDNGRISYSELKDEVEAMRRRFELFFTGQLPHPPTNSEVNRLKTRILTAVGQPQIQSDKFKLKALSCRFHQLKDYWDRILAEIEAGVFYKDLAREEYRKKLDDFEKHSNSTDGHLEKAFELLFQKYQNLSGKKIDKTTFMARAKSLYLTAKAAQPNRKVKICLVKTQTGIDLRADFN